MAMTLRLTADEDETLTRLARLNRVSKNTAAVAAIDAAKPRADHEDFVRRSTDRLLVRYASLLARLAEA